MSNAFGIHLANGDQDIARVVSLGCGRYLALEMQADYLAQCPGERYIRLWGQPDDDPARIVRAAQEYQAITRHLIPWNEPNIETGLSYREIASAFLRLRQMVGGETVLHWPALSPSSGYREHAGEWLPAARAADIVDVHAYGSAAQIIEIVDWYHSVLPDKTLLVTECNPGAGNQFDQDWWAAEYLRVVEAMRSRPWVLGVIGFIWQWHHPDMALPTTVDWIGQPIEAAVRAADKFERATGGGTMGTFRVGNLEVIDLRESLPQHATDRYEIRSIGGIEQIVIHHSATPDDRSAEAIARYHVDTLGWPGIGYHFLVHQDGSIEYTQPIEIISYGVADRNKNSLHICLPGVFTDVVPGDIQIKATKLLIDNLDYALGRVYPVVGHSEIATPGNATACPGRTWPQWKPRLYTATPAEIDWRAKYEALAGKIKSVAAEL